MKDYLNKEIRTNKKILSLFSKEDFLNYLEENKIRNTNDLTYSEITYNACRYGALYMLLAVGKKNKHLLYEVGVVEARVNYNWHCFLQTSDYYVDLTMAQFDNKYPELFIIKKSDAKKLNIYSIIRTYSFKEWLDLEENN